MKFLSWKLALGVEQNRYLERIRRMVLEYLQGEPARAFLFGSWARGEARHSSDVDVAISYQAAGGQKKIAALRDALEESTIPYRVDVVDLREASDGLREEVKRDGILWKA